MINRTCIFVGSSILFGVAILAQDRPMIIRESGTGAEPTITIAPGQIVTLWVRGLNVPPAVSKSDPLARELSGVYVLLRDGANNYSQKLPLLQIDRQPCPPGTWCNDMSVTPQVIVAQVPYDMPYGTLQRPPSPTLTVYKDGKPGFTEKAVYVQAVPRILATCMRALQMTLREDLPRYLAGQVCPPVVTKQDGSLMSTANQLTPGETISVYAWGLGLTDPVVEAGTAVKQPVRTLARYRVRVCYSCEYSPEGASYSQVGPWFDAEYVGLAIGSAGIYQINIKTPLPPPEEAERYEGPYGERAVFHFSSAASPVSEEFSVGVFYRKD
jgi:uncharacterized protein (TIGR03437 family)